MVSVSTGLDLLRSSLATVMSVASAVILFWAGSMTLSFAGLNLLVSMLPPAWDPVALHSAADFQDGVGTCLLVL